MQEHDKLVEAVKAESHLIRVGARNSMLSGLLVSIAARLERLAESEVGDE